MAVGDVVHPLAFHGRGRRHPLLRPVEILVLIALRHHELPQHLPVLFIEAKQHAAVACLRRVARRAVVRADVNAPARDDRRGMGMRPQRHAPLHIAARLQVEGIRQPALRGHHVARPRLPPLRLVRGGQAGGCEQAQQRGAAEEETRGRHHHGCGEGRENAEAQRRRGQASEDFTALRPPRLCVRHFQLSLQSQLTFSQTRAAPRASTASCGRRWLCARRRCRRRPRACATCASFGR